MAEKDYIDITPRGVDKEGKGAAGIKTTTFQETEWDHINENPNNLTKEGVKEKIEYWKKSSNRHVQMKYQTMLSRCKKFAPSGETENGHVIYSRDKKGEPVWVSSVALKKPSTKSKGD